MRSKRVAFGFRSWIIKFSHSTTVWPSLQRGDVRWWIDRCQSSQLPKQVNLMGIDCVTAEEFYLKYGAGGSLSCEDLFQYLFFLQQSPTWDNSAHMSRSDCVDLGSYAMYHGRCNDFVFAVL